MLARERPLPGVRRPQVRLQQAPAREPLGADRALVRALAAVGQAQVGGQVGALGEPRGALGAVEGALG